MLLTETIRTSLLGSLAVFLRIGKSVLMNTKCPIWLRAIRHWEREIHGLAYLTITVS